MSTWIQKHKRAGVIVAWLIGMLPAQAEPLVLYTFTGNTNTPASVGSGYGSSPVLVSPGSVAYGTAQGTTWTNLPPDSGTPYMQGTGGWTSNTQAGAKNFSFTLTNTALFDLTNMVFEARASGAGPSAIGVSINGMSVHSENMTHDTTRLISIPIIGLSASTSYVVQIQGWTNGSRVTSGGGDFRVDTIIIQGEPAFPTHYVNINSTNPLPPYTDWATAATNIQDAIDIADEDATVLVTNGVYQTGGRVLSGLLLTNRVVIDKPIVVRSVNGPFVTTILGAWDPQTNGNTAVRGVFATNGASLVGFTITNSATLASGNSRDMRGGGIWAATNVVISNCVVVGNASRSEGAGIYGGKIFNSQIRGNNAHTFGGGVSFFSSAGGAIHHSVLSGNRAANGSGGGLDGGTAINCLITENTCLDSGGGTYFSTLINCTVAANAATNSGGGVSSGVILNSIVYSNSGASTPNFFGGTFTNSCTFPMPSGSGNITNNPQFVTPFETFNVLSSSPVIDAGANSMVSSTRDLDGKIRILNGVVDMGAYEQGDSPSATTLSAISIGTTNATLRGQINPNGDTTQVYFEYGLTTNYGFTTAPQEVSGTAAVTTVSAAITELEASAEYHFRVVASNLVNISRGDDLTFTTLLSTLTHFVRLNNPSPVAPYTNWTTAATNIQDAVDVAVNGASVLVSNGVYQTGGRVAIGSLLTNRVVIDKRITVQSVHGPAVTTILGARHPGASNGNAAVRGVWMTNGASLIGFTVSTGATRTLGSTSTERRGGGVWCENGASISNCIISGNSAHSEGGGVYGGEITHSVISGNHSLSFGGGVSYISRTNQIRYSILRDNYANSGGAIDAGAAENCLIANNTANVAGGGSYDANLTHCTLTGNSAFTGGGGANLGVLRNCIVYYNSAVITNHNYAMVSEISHTCTFPMSAGVGNITNEPEFVNYGAGDVRLLASSPAINAGLNADASGATDLDGNPRILFGTVDMGAYESLSITDTNPVHFVNVANSTPAFPFNTWATAATNIQDAVDIATDGDLVLVTNGVYETGGRTVFSLALTNRVVIDKPITVQSVNGPGVTAIKGAYQSLFSTNGPAAVRAVWMTTNAILSGFTVTNGATRDDVESFLNMDANGGGVWAAGASAIITNCIVVGNVAYLEGGGVFVASVFNSRIEGNRAGSAGGGLSFLESTGSVVRHSEIVGNTAQFGGGAFDAQVDNCLLYRNHANGSGGGTYSAYLINCTVVSNTASSAAGGMIFGSAVNTIVYFNAAPTSNNYSQASFTNSCASPLPPGSGNTDQNPEFISMAAANFRLQPTSPAVDTGLNSAVGSTEDLDGNERIVGGTVDLGAYEFQGIEPTPTHFVDLDNPTPSPPYATWETAANVIQDAIDVAEPGDTVVVSNGVYRTGGRATPGQLVTNRVLIDKPIMVRSVNGPATTAIHGYDTNLIFNIRGVWMTNGASLIGFTVTNGLANFAPISGENARGGGILAYGNAAISNCVIIGNVANSRGGGLDGGRAYNCVIAYNRTFTLSGMGGGAFGAQLVNCTVVTNFAGAGGGLHSSTSINSIVVFNRNFTVEDNYVSSEFISSCTFPLPGVGNIDSDPQFEDPAGFDYRLQSNSLCINAGNNTFAAVPLDIDGNPRIVGGTVDMGAYESSVVPPPPPQPQALPGSPIVTDDPFDQNNIGDNFDFNTNGVSAVSVFDGGYGNFGQLYINYDTTNLYIGAHGVEMLDPENYMTIFIGLNTLSDNAMNLLGRGGFPNGLDQMENLHFGDPMDIAIVLGDEFGDGNFPNFNIASGNDVGQGVFYLQNTNFAAMTGAVLSQFDGTNTVATLSVDDDGNRLTDRWEVKMPWSDLNAVGIVSVTQLHILGVFAADVYVGSDAYLSANYLGSGVSGGSRDGLGNYAWSTVTVFAVEVELPVDVDADGDGISDAWEVANGLNPSLPGDAGSNVDGDDFTDYEEYLADTHPTNGLSFFPLVEVTNAPAGAMTIVIDPTTNSRVYGIYFNTNLLEVPQQWFLYPPEQTGTGSALQFNITNEVPERNYRTGVRLP